MNTGELDKVFSAVLDITDDPAHLNFELRAVIKRECEQVIAAAVQQEREACAMDAENVGLLEHDRHYHDECDFSDSTGAKIAAAIRARGNGSK